ncbi:MAG: EAL domain-containing protein, partial [Epsilonproteobacteria bacterium]|nr:EAL domain-containing protein [Campylobacterota bacterium]
RVVHSDGKVESIFPYLQIAKDNKLYSQITKNVLLQSIEVFKKNHIPFNVNFSIEDIMDDSIIEILHQTAQKYPELIHQVTFEILESESIHDYGVIKNFVAQVKAYGAKVAIDDFGSGYSNFEHIINLDIDFIKIDGSLIKNITTDKNAYNIVSLIHQFANQTGILTVAEFVETQEIYEVLQEIGIDFAQGYYFAKPQSDIVYLKDSSST